MGAVKNTERLENIEYLGTKYQETVPLAKQVSDRLLLLIECYGIAEVSEAIVKRSGLNMLWVHMDNLIIYYGRPIVEEMLAAIVLGLRGDK